MRRSEAFPTKYLSKDDVKMPVTATILGVRMETLTSEDGDDKQKPILYFEGEHKPLVLNNTNWMTIEDAYGDESDEWRGQKVELYFEPNIAFGNKRVGGIRIHIPKNGNGNTPTPGVTGPGVSIPSSQRLTDEQRQKLVSKYIEKYAVNEADAVDKLNSLAAELFKSKLADLSYGQGVELWKYIASAKVPEIGL